MAFLILGVDILPSEIAIDASNHFGELLVPLLKDLVAGNSKTLSPVLESACIARDGSLTERYEYINQLSCGKDEMDRNSDSLPCITLSGHLFDTGLINKAFDLLESVNVKFRVRNLYIRPNEISQLKSSKVEIELEVCKSKLADVVSILKIQLSQFPEAQATIAME